MGNKWERSNGNEEQVKRINILDGLPPSRGEQNWYKTPLNTESGIPTPAWDVATDDEWWQNQPIF